MNYHKKIEIWGDFTITVTDYDQEDSESICGVLITSHDPDEEGTKGGSFNSPQCIFVVEEEIPLLIKALQEFVE